MKWNKILDFYFKLSFMFKGRLVMIYLKRIRLMSIVLVVMFNFGSGDKFITGYYEWVYICIIYDKKLV